VSTNHSWLESYAAAMLELDLVCLPGRIEAARAAIGQAMEELAGNHERSSEELRSMSSALGNLQALQRVTFKSSSPAEYGLSSDRGAAYATLVPQDNSAVLAQTAIGDDGTAPSRESRDRSQKTGIPERHGCDA
jgi:hypothetical protein